MPDRNEVDIKVSIQATSSFQVKAVGEVIPKVAKQPKIKIVKPPTPSRRLLVETFLFVIDVLRLPIFVVVSPYLIKNSSPVHYPAGHLALLVLSLAFPKKTFEKHFAPIIADMREETNELDAEGRTVKRRYIVLVYHGSLILSVAAYIVFSVVKRAKAMWSAI